MEYDEEKIQKGIILLFTAFLDADRELKVRKLYFERQRHKALHVDIRNMRAKTIKGPEGTNY